MATEPGVPRLIDELRQTLDHMQAELDRIELLTAALHGFAQAVPDYAPSFQHLTRIPLSAHEIGRGD